MRPSDFKQALALWKSSKGVGLRSDDNHAQVANYLKRNQGISLVALWNGRMVGTVMGGHDGRRGNLVHLAVADGHRRKGIGRLLAEECLTRLKKAGIPRTHVMVFKTNRIGRSFWKSMGWEERPDLALFSSPFKEGPGPKGCSKSC